MARVEFARVADGLRECPKRRETVSKIRLPPSMIGSLSSIAACFPRRRNVAPDACATVPFIAAGETVKGSGERAVFAKDRRLDLRVEADSDNREIASRGEFFERAS